MSHWKKFESNVLKSVKRDTLGKALADMSTQLRSVIGLDYSTTRISNTWGKETVTAAFTVNGKVIALGANLSPNADGTEALQVSGDFYGTGLNENGFVDKLAQSYKKVDIIEQVEEQGWTIDEINFDAKGEVVIDAYRTA
jgi:hypothetical protein